MFVQCNFIFKYLVDIIDDYISNKTVDRRFDYMCVIENDRILSIKFPDSEICEEVIILKEYGYDTIKKIIDLLLSFRFFSKFHRDVLFGCQKQKHSFVIFFHYNT